MWATDRVCWYGERTQFFCNFASNVKIHRRDAETSVLFAVLLGSWFLKERFTLQRFMGAGTIVAGVMALRLG